MRHLVREAGYPFPAHAVIETSGERVFAATSPSRVIVLGALRRCGICGRHIDVGDKFWAALRVSDFSPEQHPELHAEPETSGALVVEVHKGAKTGFAAPELGAHRACMLYAATVCPFLSNPDYAYRRDHQSYDVNRVGTTTGPKVLIEADTFAMQMVRLKTGYGPQFMLGGPAIVRRYATEELRRLALEAAEVEAPDPDADELVVALQSLDELDVNVIVAHDVPGVRSPAPGRNDDCPCGSERKWKQCHGDVSRGSLRSVVQRPFSERARKAMVVGRQSM